MGTETMSIVSRDDGQPRRSKGDQAGGLNLHVSTVKRHAEIAAIMEALERTNWNRKQAAGLLQISYKVLLGKIRRYSLASVSPQLDVNSPGDRCA